MSRHLRRKDINNLDSLLAYIYEEYIEIRKDDFFLHYRVFDVIFQQLRKKMEEVDDLYKLHTSTVDFMGSHYDRLRIKKPDEFDTFNIIKLPHAIVNCKDFEIIAKEAAFVYIKMGAECKYTINNGPNSNINRKILTWIDSSGYLQRSCFFDWFKGVVDNALNQFKRNTYSAVFDVDGKQYTVIRSETGPAITLKINSECDNFSMDVDLVPALKFSEDLWPPGPGYVQIPAGCSNSHWMVVPKPNKNKKEVTKTRSWRIAMPQQERQMMHDSYNLRQAIRLLKKLRDAKGMTAIASYYIKQMVFMEINRRNKKFWTQSTATLFKILVKIFYDAMVKGRIPYFWNKNNNLIENVNSATLKVYENTLQNLLDVLEDPQRYMEVASFLLTSKELQHF